MLTFKLKQRIVFKRFVDGRERLSGGVHTDFRNHLFGLHLDYGALLIHEFNEIK